MEIFPILPTAKVLIFRQIGQKRNPLLTIITNNLYFFANKKNKKQQKTVQEKAIAILATVAILAILAILANFLLNNRK